MRPHAIVRARRALMARALRSPRLAPHAARFGRGTRAYTAYGEDLVLAQLFAHAPRGTYVDVGAFHPYDGSLTHALHLAGWSGFSVDASESAIATMRRARPDDRHLVAAIGTPSRRGEFVEFETGSLSSADPALATHRSSSGERVVARRAVELRGLADVFDELGVPPRFDFLNVDIEGLDEAALASNDWAAFRPDVVAVEDSLAALGGPASTPIGRLLTEQGYRRAAALPPTSIFAEPWVVERLLRSSGVDPATWALRPDHVDG